MKKQLMTLPENKTRQGNVPPKVQFLLSPVARVIALTILMATTHAALADDYFNPAALNNVSGENIADLVSLEQFSQSGKQLPGEYYVTVVVNNQNMGSATVRFIQNEKTQELVPVVTKAILKEWGVKTDVLPAFKELSDDEEISDTDTRIPQSQSHFIFDLQRLNLSIPQASMSQEARGFVDESEWDQGLPAFLLNYTVNGAKTWYTRSNNSSQENQFVSLQSGINLGAWRVRNFSTYSHNNGESNWSNVKNYVERNIQPLHSRLTLGDTATSGDVFESVPFRGVRMSSDDAMLPAGQRGFAPVVRGIAQSSAQVTIRQNGYVIYQTYVAPGPFEISDLYPSSYSGNLDVTIEEDDGRERTFVVPFSSLAMMQREGSLKYSLNLGEYRTGTENTKEPRFFEGSAAYGMPLNTTLYGGTIYSSDYQAYSLGAGLNLGSFGALSADVIHAVTTQAERDEKEKGKSYRFQYSKSMMQTGTTLALAGYRYSTQGYYDFAEANENNGSNTRYNKRTRIQADISQSLGDAGGLYFSAYQQNFWGLDGEEHTINTGYTNSFRQINYSVAYTYTDTPATDKADHQFAVNISIPLGGSNNYSLISSMTTSRDNGTTAMTGFSGSALENNALNYSIQQGYDFRQHNNSGNAGVSYRGNTGFMNAGYNYGNNSQRVNYSVQGGVVVHPYGVTLSQPLGDTIALVRAPGAAGVAVQNKNGVKTDSRGYAVIPSLTAYTKNDVTLNINGMDEQVELLNNSTTVTPTRGAVVLAEMQTRIGSRVLLKLIRQGNVLPFGAIASETGSDSSGIVDENGVVYLSGMPDSGKVNVKWGSRPDEQCSANYELTAGQSEQIVKQVTAACQ